MRTIPRLAVATAVLALAAAAPAQVGNGETGLLLVKPSGNAGVLCTSQFSCTFVATPLVRGEQVTAVVRGVHMRPFALALGVAQPPLCLPLPGLHNALLFVPAAVPFIGVLDEADSILACPGGRKQLPFQVPVSLSPGTEVLFQALAWSYLAPSEVPTLTVAVRGRVQ